MTETPRRQRQAGDQVWFGIGCFHFGYQKEVPFKFRRRDYVRDLKSALEDVPAITDVMVEVPGGKVNVEDFEVTEQPSSLNGGAGHFPPISHGGIRFKIYMPARVQVDLAGQFAPR